MKSRVARVLLLLSFVVYGHGARAQETPSVPAPAPETQGVNVVEVVVVGSEVDLQRLRGAVASGDFGGRQARFRRGEHFDGRALLERRPAEREVSARVWIVLRSERAELYFADRSFERFLVRDVPLPNGMDPVASEAVSQVLALSVTALLDGAEPALNRSQAERLLAPDSAAHELPPQPPHRLSERRPAPASHAAFAVAASYATRVFGDGVAFVHGPGVMLGWMEQHARIRTTWLASAHYELPQRHTLPDVGVEWSTLAVRAGFELLARSGSSRVSWGGRLGGGADVIDFTPRAGSTGNGALLTARRSAVVPVLAPSAVASLDLGERVAGSAELFADCYPTRVTYAIVRDGISATVLAPWRVRPGVALRLWLR